MAAEELFECARQFREMAEQAADDADSLYLYSLASEYEYAAERLLETGTSLPHAIMLPA